MPIYTKPCPRAGCTGLVQAKYPSHLKKRRFHSHACRALAFGEVISDKTWYRKHADIDEMPMGVFTDADLVAALRREFPALSSPPESPVRSPANDVQHKRIQTEQLEAFRLYKETAEYQLYLACRDRPLRKAV